MREIKFRCWDKVLNKFASEYKLYFTGAVSISDVWATSDCVVEQFTGMKNMNGVEIYEGDILENKRGRKGVVKFDLGCFQWLGDPVAYEFEDEETAKVCMPETWAKVVGNVHQNADLL